MVEWTGKQVSVLFNFEGLAFGLKRPKVGGAMSEPIALFRGSRTGDHEKRLQITSKKHKGQRNPKRENAGV